MATYIFIFLSELIPACVLWFVLKKALKTTKLYRIVVVCLIVSLAVGYVVSYRMVGYQVTMDYLTTVNNQRIQETGQGITLEEENELKEQLFQSREFRELLADSSIKLSLLPFIFVAVIMLFLARRGIGKLLPQGEEASGSSIADYSKAIRANPRNAGAYFNRGEAYAEVGEYAQAITDYSKAIELTRNHAASYFNRGCAYGEMGKYDKAIADYDKAIELNPNDSSAYYNRALAYREKDEVSKAVSDLEKCISLSTDAELTEDAQRTLSEVRKSA